MVIVLDMHVFFASSSTNCPTDCSTINYTQQKALLFLPREGLNSTAQGSPARRGTLGTELQETPTLKGLHRTGKFACGPCVVTGAVAGQPEEELDELEEDEPATLV